MGGNRKGDLNMVEKITLQNLFPSLSPSNKVKVVNRQERGSQQRRFDRQLHEEEEKNKKREQRRNALETTETDGEKIKGREMAETGESVDQDPEKKKEIGDDTQGRLIDILV